MRLVSGYVTVASHASPTLTARLSAKISIDPETGCWNWTGSRISTGYGNIVVGQRKTMLVHRVTWELRHGTIAPGLTIDHLCRNRRCCNPDHLEPVDHATNVSRGSSGVIQRNKTHCPQGHPYDDQNTYYYQGRRYCKECNRVQQRKPNGKRADCHPDRPHRGHGLCNACYLRHKRSA